MIAVRLMKDRPTCGVCPSESCCEQMDGSVADQTKTKGIEHESLLSEFATKGDIDKARTAL